MDIDYLKSYIDFVVKHSTYKSGKDLTIDDLFYIINRMHWRYVDEINNTDEIITAMQNDDSYILSENKIMVKI